MRLPTSDMVAQALPERILEPGERVAGFVYFAGLEDDAERVELAFDLVEPETGTSLARMGIPFTTAEDGAELPERARDPGLDRPPEPAAIRVY